MRLAGTFGLVTVLLTAASPLRAATIEVHGEFEPPVITLDGIVEPKDLAAFQDKARGLSQAVVRLRSIGGSILPAMAIGRELRQLGFSTEVREYCNSACSLIWMAGATRYLPPGSRLGFHQPREMNHAVSISGVAQEAAYLARLGVTDAAITWAVSAAPTDLRWLTLEDARRFAIAVVPGSAQTAARPLLPRLSF